VLLFPAVLLIGSGAADLGRWLGVPGLQSLESTMSGFGRLPWWLPVLLIGLGPGVGEELYYRGFLGRGLIGTHGVVAGVLLTALLFGVMHIIPIQVFYAPVIGVVLHYVYLQTRSLLMPMLLHTLNNGVGMLLLSEDLKPYTGGLREAVEGADTHSTLFAAWVYAGSLALLAGVGYALYQTRGRVAAPDGGPAPWRPAFPGVAWPPPDSGAAVVYPRLNAAGALAAAAGVLAFAGAWVLAFTAG
jgi:CAAX protease family protein